MNTNRIKVCGACWKEDNTGTAVEVSLISCDNCGLWIHVTCIPSHRTNNDDTFLCDSYITYGQ